MPGPQRLKKTNVSDFENSQNRPNRDGKVLFLFYSICVDAA